MNVINREQARVESNRSSFGANTGRLLSSYGSIVLRNDENARLVKTRICPRYSPIYTVYVMDEKRAMKRDPLVRINTVCSRAV